VKLANLFASETRWGVSVQETPSPTSTRQQATKSPLSSPWSLSWAPALQADEGGRGAIILYQSEPFDIRGIAEHPADRSGGFIGRIGSIKGLFYIGLVLCPRNCKSGH